MADKLTVKQLAEKAGVSGRTIYRWEKTGKIPTASLEDGQRVWDADVLEASNAQKGKHTLAEKRIEPTKKPRAARIVAPRKLDTWDYTKGYNAALSTSDPVLYRQSDLKASIDYQYDFGLYHEAVDKDEHLTAVLLQRKTAVLSKDRSIIPADDTKQAAYAASFIEAVFDGISQGDGDAGFPRDLMELLDAVAMGVAYSEVVWETRDVRFKPKGYAEAVTRYDAFVPQAILSRHPRRFVYDEDDNCRLLTMESADLGIPIAPYTIMVFRPQTRYEDPQGYAALRVVWWATWMKREVRRFWLKFLERFGDPVIVITPEMTLADADQAALTTAINNVQQQTGWILPPGCQLSLVEAQRYGTIASYSEFCNWLNQEITKAILGQTTTLDVPVTGDNRTVGEVTQQVALSLTQLDARALEALVNGTLIPWIMQWNLPNHPYPKFRIDTDPPKDLFGLAKVVRNLWEMGFPIDEDWMEKTFGVPLARDESKALPGPQPHEGEKMPARVKPTSSSNVPAGKRAATSSTGKRGTSNVSSSEAG